MSAKNLIKDLEKLSDPQKAKGAQRYFKTGKGEYGEGDIFLGITTPNLRQVVKKYFALPQADLSRLLSSKIHEHRSAALAILVHQYEKAQKESLRKYLVDFYLKNTQKINNWDLVDISAPKILGEWLSEDRDRVRDRVLYKLAKSENLWEKRIAVMATFAFIRKNQFKDSLKIAEILLNDKHDLIHKAVGWMLREVGKRDLATEEKFLQKFAAKMPRTMLRYAIEKFP